MNSGPGTEGLQVSDRVWGNSYFAEQGRIQLLSLSPSCPNPFEGLVKGGGPPRGMSWETPKRGQGATLLFPHGR